VKNKLEDTFIEETITNINYKVNNKLAKLV